MCIRDRRLGGGKIADLLKYILQECEITNYEIQGLERVFNGFIIENQTNGRALLNELIQTFNIGFYIKAVSYTHLDVYKRQGLIAKVFGIDEDLRQLGFDGAIDKYFKTCPPSPSKVLAFKAVSYTHLDVYKRQA